MNCKRSFPLFLVVCLLAVACSLPFGAAQSALPAAATQSEAGSTQSLATKGPSSEALQASAADMLKSFPMPPDSQTDTGGAISNDPEATSGSFRILSGADLAAVVKFYETELPKQGWLLRYTDPTRSCGATQYWKNDTLYLMLIFGYENSRLFIHVQYQRVDTQSLNKYLADFPLPASSELVKSSDTSWEFYVLQDYKAVEAFYKQKLLSLGWTANGVLPQVEASCGDDDPGCGSGNHACPSGGVSMPSPTFDLRQRISLLYTMPNKNEAQIDIIPHGDATRLLVSLTIKSSESAGLPGDMPIYPGAVLLLAAPGTAEYQIDASVKTVKDYYAASMKEAGWAPDGDAYETSGMYLQNWTKDNQKITVTISSYEDGSMLILDCSTCR
jgi:hypothetical protein